MSSPDNGKNIISSLNPTLLYLQYLLHNARFAVVAQDGTGNYTTIQAAVAAGEKTIFVKEGTYSITSDLVLSGQSLISLAPGKAILSMVDATIELETHTATTAYKTGTCTLTNNSTTVTGILTAWDTGANCPSTYTNPWLIGQGMALKVASIQNDTSLLLEDQYRGTTQTINYFLIDAKNINSEISGFTIIHEPTAPRPCIKVSGIGCRVKNNVLRCDRVNTSYAIYGGASAISVVHSAEISNNDINGGVRGICLKNAHSCLVQHNVLQNFTSDVMSTNTDDGDCYSNTFTNNKLLSCSGTAFVIDNVSPLTTVSYNILLSHMGDGIQITDSNYCDVSHNIIDSRSAFLTNAINITSSSDYLRLSHNDCLQSHSVTIESSYASISFNVGGQFSITGSYNSVSSNSIVDGELILTGSYSTIGNNSVYSNGVGAYGIRSVGSYNTVTGNVVREAVDQGIGIGGTGNTCTGNSIYDTSSIGIHVSGQLCSISNNSVLTAGSYGIEVDAAAVDCSVIGNIIKSTIDHGIYCTANRTKINGNTCNNSTQSGIYIETGGQCIVNGNGCDSNATYGIFIANTSDRIIINDNICLNNTTAQIQNNGTNTVQADNIVA